jgi:hypothetical protein
MKIDLLMIDILDIPETKQVNTDVNMEEVYNDSNKQNN